MALIEDQVVKIEDFSYIHVFFSMFICFLFFSV